MDEYQLAIAEIRLFMHSAKLEKVGIDYVWNCTENGPDFGDGDQCIGVNCGNEFEIFSSPIKYFENIYKL